MLVQKCPHCQKPLRIPEDATGKNVRCPGCRNSFVVTAAVEIAVGILPWNGAIFVLECRGCTAKLGISKDYASAQNRAKCKKCGTVMSFEVETSTEPSEQQSPIPEMTPPSPPQAGVGSGTLPEEVSNGSLPREFLTELMRLARKFDNRPSRHLKTLEARFIKRRQALREKWNRFRAEMQQLVDRVIVDPVKLLPSLEVVLSGWRQRTVQKLNSRMADSPLDEGDPLNCGISLFGTMDFGRLERAHTKVLAWFLDPSKEHGFGSLLLKSLLETLGCDVSQLTDSSILSIAEALIDRQRRLDVLVQGKLNSNLRALAIEAKVDANEGDSQLESYDEWLANKFGEENVLRLFLSPDGHAAETSDKWKSLSFLELASCFRVALPALRSKPGYHFLLYYLSGILKDIYRWRLPMPRTGFDTCVDPYRFLNYINAVDK